jgi:glycosyltransferase involved in cell wall biosynthesis
MARGVFDQVICVSNSVHTAIQPLIGRLPCTVVPNGTAIPPKQDRQPHGPSPVFGIAMRLNADKGALCIPDIAQELAAQCPGAKLLIAGDGDAAAKLSLLIRSHHLSDVAVQLGYCAEMADFWSRVDVSLFISPRDTFGLTIIESMAHGVPVVGFRSGAGSDEVLLQTDRDFVVESGQPRQLVRTALELYRNQSRMDNFRTCGMTLVQERYSISAVTARVAEIYREMPR